MKKILIFILTLLLTAAISGQTTEFSEQLSSGLFSFGGSFSASSYLIHISNEYTYTENPYGRRSSFSYTFGPQVQRITKSGYIFGLQISCESLSSKVKVEYQNTGNQFPIVSDGKTIFTGQFISFHPFLGKRIKLIGWLTTDLTLGTDLGILLNIREHETGITDGIKYDYNYIQNTQILDIRPRIEIVNYYKKLGLTIGYSFGLTNYTKNMDGGNPEAFSRMVRFGMAYRF